MKRQSLIPAEKFDFSCQAGEVVAQFYGFYGAEREDSRHKPEVRSFSEMLQGKLIISGNFFEVLVRPIIHSIIST